jgi:hypothetical protein
MAIFPTVEVAAEGISKLLIPFPFLLLLCIDVMYNVMDFVLQVGNMQRQLAEGFGFRLLGFRVLAFRV